MFDAREIAGLLQADVLGTQTEHLLTDVVIDSRLIRHPSSTLFVAMPGRRRHGVEYVETLYDQGVRHFVVPKDAQTVVREDAILYRVPTPLVALQSLATAYRNKLTIPVIGITGSNGKTIVKEWLTQLLSTRYSVSKSPGSYNSQIGVALSILGISENADLAIIEAGISRYGEMERLEQMIQPDYGIFTNIGDAHSAGFESKKQKQKEKEKLFKRSRWWVHNDMETEAKNQKSWGCHLDSELTILRKGNTLQMQNRMFPLPFEDPASIQNLGHCIAFLALFDETILDEVSSQTGDLEKVDMRTAVRTGVRGCKIVSDYYNLDRESLSNVLDLANQISGQLPITLIMSDLIDQKTDQSDYQSIVKRIKQASVEQLIAIGPQWTDIHGQVSGKIKLQSFPSTEAFIDSKIYSNWQDRLIVLKGARRFQFERIEKHLLRPVYGTRLEIDLTALRHNWIQFDQLISDDVKKMVMVKASAYGSGGEEIARFFQENHVDYLAVAYPNEAISLRENGVIKPIMVMNAEPGALTLLEAYDLEPEIHGMEHLKAFLREMTVSGKLKIHVKIETGMHRLGFEKEEIPQLLDILGQNNHRLTVQSIFSHLSAADDPEADAYSREQIIRFSDIYETISRAIGYHPIKHIANSAATLRFPEAHFDMVRLGIALYGTGLPKETGLDLHPVHSLKTYIIQVKERSEGDLIGYGLEGQVLRPSRIATIPVGYADGIPRSMGNGRLEVMVRGKKAPSIGRICMDMTMIDVTDIPDCDIHDEVEIFGPNIPLDTFSELAGTISYEVLVSVGNRIERVITKA